VHNQTIAAMALEELQAISGTSKAVLTIVAASAVWLALRLLTRILRVVSGVFGLLPKRAAAARIEDEVRRVGGAEIRSTARAADTFCCPPPAADRSCLPQLPAFLPAARAPHC
jgi:hypothetical protein